MTKPREKTREELQAEIEDGKKKIRQFENREKMLRQKLSNCLLSARWPESLRSQRRRKRKSRRRLRRFLI